MQCSSDTTTTPSAHTPSRTCGWFHAAERSTIKALTSCRRLCTSRPVRRYIGSLALEVRTQAPFSGKNASEVPWLATQLYDDAREATNWGWAKVEANRTAFEVVFMDSYRKQQLDRVIITK